MAGQATPLQGHCEGLAAHLSTQSTATLPRGASVRGGAVREVQGRSRPMLVGALAQPRRLPPAVRHVWLVDRGMRSRPRLRALEKVGPGVGGRVRGPPGVYVPPPAAAGPRATCQRRPRVYGQPCRVEPLQSYCAAHLREQKMVRRVHGRERLVRRWDTEVGLRGGRGRPLPVRVIMLVVPGLQLQPWSVLSTEKELEPQEAVRAADGREQIAVHIDAVHELGLAP